MTKSNIYDQVLKIISSFLVPTGQFQKRYMVSKNNKNYKNKKKNKKNYHTKELFKVPPHLTHISKVYLISPFLFIT